MFCGKAGATRLDDEGKGTSAEAVAVHNAHWLSGKSGNGAEGVTQPLGEGSAFFGYYDATSLYPSSSKYKCTPKVEGIS